MSSKKHERLISFAKWKSNLYLLDYIISNLLYNQLLVIGRSSSSSLNLTGFGSDRTLQFLNETHDVNQPGYLYVNCYITLLDNF